MSSRKSTMLRFMLAAIALLGIGAAVTAAAWEDRVYMEVEASGATFNMQGRIATGEAPDGDDGWNGPGAGWVESATEGAIQLTAAFADLVPGDTHTFWVQLRNNSSAGTTAYANGLGASWTDGTFAACDPGNLPTVDATALSADVPTPLAAGQATAVYEMTLSVPDDWDAECMGETDHYVSFLQYSTSEPIAP